MTHEENCRDLFNETCKFIRKSASNLTVEQLKSSFDIFVNQLDEIENIDEKYNLIEKILCSLNNLPERRRKLTELDLLNHRLFLILRDFIIINQLHEKSTKQIEIFYHTCGLFHNISLNFNYGNINLIKKLFLSKELIDVLSNCLNEIELNIENELFLRSIGSLLLSYKNLRRNEISSEEYFLIDSIKINVIKCLSSSTSKKLIENFERSFLKRINDIEMLYLDLMIKYVQWYPSDHYHFNDFIPIVHNLLETFVQWLINCDYENYFQSSSKLMNLIRHLSSFLIRPIDFDNLYLISELFYEDYCRLVSYWSTILLKKISLIRIDRDNRIGTRLVIQNLYNLTLHSNVLHFMKTIPNLISMLLETSQLNDDEIRLNSYRSLGKLMNEKDIKTMTNSFHIVQIHLDFIRNTIDDRNNQQRFLSLLESLKNFVEHDQVKSEIIEQNGLSLLIKCVFDERNKVEKLALEILLGLSFNRVAFSLLQTDENLIKHIRNLIKDKSLSNIERIGEALLWKLEKEDKLINDNDHQYDLMISYSHKDRQIVFQIHEQLIQDGIRVWIDRDCLRGSTMVGIANAIENSRSILICMSTSYKQSVFCQSEAHYAFETSCQIIPIIIEHNYKPDGWLGMIVSGKIYVDFTLQQFHTAYQLLKNQFIQYQQNSIESKKNDLQIIQQINKIQRNYPSCLTQWTEDDVRIFLIENQFQNSFVYLCSNMNGIYLRQFYQMCFTNQQSMFISLKHQLYEQHHKLLTIYDYLHFLNQIKPFVSSHFIQNDQIRPVYSFTFCNLI